MNTKLLQAESFLKKAEQVQPCHTCKEEIQKLRTALRDGNEKQIKSIKLKTDLGILGSKLAMIGAKFMIKEPVIFKDYLHKEQHNLNKVFDYLVDAYAVYPHKAIGSMAILARERAINTPKENAVFIKLLNTYNFFYYNLIDTKWKHETI
jgi:hypothetical protein